MKVCQTCFDVAKDSSNLNQLLQNKILRLLETLKIFLFFFSGAEDKHGYLWDRHYGICLAKFPHTDVVNSVAFNPKDPEMLVTTSDDHTIKIWRSRAKVRELSLTDTTFATGIEIIKGKNKRYNS